MDVKELARLSGWLIIKGGSFKEGGLWELVKKCISRADFRHFNIDIVPYKSFTH